MVPVKVSTSPIMPLFSSLSTQKPKQLRWSLKNFLLHDLFATTFDIQKATLNYKFYFVKSEKDDNIF